MTFDTPARLPTGFSCASRNCGIKKDGRDLSLFVSDVDAAAAAIFTRNQFPGAPIIVGRETIRGGVLRAIIVNSRVSNVATGEDGIANARRMADAAAQEVGTRADHVLVSSTGVIGVPLPIEKIEAGVRGMSAALTADPLVGAEGIMTTDTLPKGASRQITLAGQTVTITGISKGAGMIRPNMATMLGYVATDAKVAQPVLQHMLRQAADLSFNRITIDGDTSTNDSCILIATGQAQMDEISDTSSDEYTELARAVNEVMLELAQAIVRGGTTLRDFISPDGAPGYFEQELSVYGRGGQPCPRCGRLLRQATIAQRATVWCGSCQR